MVSLESSMKRKIRQGRATMVRKGGTTPEFAPVDHTYRDYAGVTARELLGADYAGLREDRFPAKLYAILSEPAYAPIVRWLPHGRAWRVVDKPRFEAVVMPRYFDARSYESFNRSANGYGFKVGVLRALRCSDDGIGFKLILLLTLSTPLAPLQGRSG